jgi:hypothetical protein
MEQTGSDQSPVGGYCDHENHAYLSKKPMENFSSTFGLGKQATQTMRHQVDNLLRPSHLQFPSVKTNETSAITRDSQKR